MTRRWTPSWTSRSGSRRDFRYHSPVLQGAIDGLLSALAAWRSVAVRLLRLPKDVAEQEVNAIRRTIPPELRSAQVGQPTSWAENPSGMRAECDAAIRALQALPSGTPSLRLLAAYVANLFASLAAVLDGQALAAILKILC